MNSNYFIQELGFEFDIQSISNDVKTFAKNIGIDAVHCSGEYPAVFLKEVSDFNIDTLEDIAEIQRKIWNNSSVVFLYVVSPIEIRIYNCNEKPVFFNTENIEIENELRKKEIEVCKKSDSKKLSILSRVFSAIAIDSGKIWTSEYSGKIKLQTKVDRYLVDSLLKLAKKLRKNLAEDIIHSLLMRSIFIMYLQDRKAIPKEIWDKTGERNFLNLLDDKNKTYILFAEIEKHFNGNVFPEGVSEKQKVTNENLKLIKKCLIDGDIDLSQQKLFNDWRLFDFSFIRIELLSEIYENFLNEFDPATKKQTGTYYTPPSLVELVLDNVLPKTGNDYKKKILDPACGSGIFLALAYKRIVNYWKNRHPNDKLTFTILSEIMQDSIFGVEIDPKSIKVAVFSLYLALLDFLHPRDVWLKNGEKFPYLIKNLKSDDEKDKKGNNLFCADTIAENGDFENISFDIVIGNPPFGTKNLLDNVKKYCEENSFDKQFVIPFIHKSVKLCTKGKIALLFNTKLLTNTKQTAQNFRKWLFNDNYVEKIYNLSILRKAPKDFGGHLFSSAVVPTSIICFQKNPPKEPKPTIEYWAPKTFIKSHVAEGVLVDSTDIKYLPREICQQPDTKIWKIAQWGTMADYFLIGKLLRNREFSFEDYLNLNKIEHGVGFQPLAKSKAKPKFNKEFSKIQFVDASNLERYYTHKTNKKDINACIKSKEAKEFYLKYYNVDSIDNLPKINVFRRLGNLNSFKAPHVLIKEGQTKNLFCASYLEFPCTFTSTVLGIKGENIEQLKTIVGYLNSQFSSYFLFLTSSSWGVERERVKPNELYELPAIPNSIDISNCIDSIILKKNNSYPMYSDINDESNDIEKAIHLGFNIHTREKILIEDIINYSMDLFDKGEKSIALKPIASQNPETIPYAQMLCDEINDFLKVGDFKMNVIVYKVSPHTPLCMVVLKFVNPDKLTTPQLIDSEKNFQENLNTINKYTLKEYSQNIYVRKQVRYYEDDTIFIIKPNQKRFWTRSQGIEDASTIINELIAMDDE